MKAVYVKEFGAAANLEIRAVEDLSKPESKEVLIKVKAAGLIRADIAQRMGFYPAPKGFPERILGLEFAGEVAEIGDAVTEYEIGDRVFGITAGGAQAEFLLTDKSLLAPIPDNLSFTKAAAVPEAFITAHDAIFTQGDLQANETLLIHAVGSGVGLAALQLAKAKDIVTVGTSRTAAKLLKCDEFSLDFGIVTETNLIESNPEALAEIIQHKTDGSGVDVILDLVGAKYFAANLESLNLKGRLILVGLTGGSRAEFNLGTALSKRLKIIGTVLRSRPAEEKAYANRKFIEDVLPLVAAGKIKPNLDKVFPVESVREAHEYLESNQSFGKVVLEL